jgi:DNA-binding NtrC family response regulator
MGQSQVLLVDDDQPLLGVPTEAFRAEGYLALPAIGGDVARVLLQQQVPFRPLIADIFLPGLLDGVALARRAREFCPGIAIIYSTGYPQVAHIRAQSAPYGEMRVTPGKADAMLTAVSSALGEDCRVALA